MENDEKALRLVEMDLDLYKFYLELLHKIGAFVLGVTGALVSYYLAQQKQQLIVYSLLLPFVINVGVFLICILNVATAKAMNQVHEELCADAGVDPAYELAPLSSLLRLYSGVFGLIALGIATLVVSHLLRYGVR